ncbi:MAG: UvrD-helicase domain-containing protein, partial [Akkermansia sp.]|nr:UvrD-helicase domain-containing protein [Akkermansia sp.]
MARRYVIRQDAAPVAPISGIDYRTALNEEQYAAVSSEPGPALVIAGAGSGKTRTLTYRVAWLLDHGTDPWNILLLTFTNKAAREMTERVRSLIPLDLSRLWSGTFHSIANRILRQHAEYLGYTPAFTIMDSDDRKSMIKSVVKSLKLDEKSTRFPKPEVLSSLFSLADNEGANIRETLENAYPYLSNHLDAILEVHDQYVARKQETNSMDFDDLLLNVVRLFQEQEHLRALYGSRFQHILVDEYQDTNYLQSRLIDMLAREHGQLMVVGDDAQSIYSWRGADMENILSFTTRYPAAKTFKIETNYRSVPEILELSNAAIAANEVQIEKQLRSVRPTGEMPPALVPLNDDRMQAKFVVQRIRDLIEEGTDPSEIAVLYRAHFHSMELQMELTRGEIPFRITSGIRFFEQAHIKDVVAFMRFVVNP